MKYITKPHSKLFAKLVFEMLKTLCKEHKFEKCTTTNEYKTFGLVQTNLGELRVEVLGNWRNPVYGVYCKFLNPEFYNKLKANPAISSAISRNSRKHNWLSISEKKDTPEEKFELFRTWFENSFFDLLPDESNQLDPYYNKYYL